jgi:hypothetical protein
MESRKIIEQKTRFDINDFFFPFLFCFLQGGKDTPALQYGEWPGCSKVGSLS